MKTQSLIIIIALLIVAAVLTATIAADSGRVEPGSAKKTPVVTLESIPGSSVKRVILSAKAAERLGIETGKVDQQVALNRLMVGGLVISPMDNMPQPAQPSGMFGGFGNQTNSAAPNGIKKIAAASTLAPQTGTAEAPAALPIIGDAWVLVALSQGEWDRLDKDKPARILPLSTRAPLPKEVLAQPTGLPPVEDPKRTMLNVYYVVHGNDHGLIQNSRMRVELQMAGSQDKQLAAPYSAIYYDGKGDAWVYLNPRPLVYERHRVAVERVAGDWALLSNGPPVGSPVVTVGAALLYGAEVFGK